MQNRKIFAVVLAAALVIPFFLSSGCVKSRYQFIKEENEKDPTHLNNVPAVSMTAMNGTWHNPAIKKDCLFYGGREIYFWQITSQDPVFPSVLVRDIKRVAPGRYRGVPANPKHRKEITHITYSLIGRDKLLTRWHYASGKKEDCVYDKVKLCGEKRYENEYQAFLKESERLKESDQKAEQPLVTGSEDKNSKKIEKPSVVIYKIHTEPDQITSGSKFDLIVEYGVTDPAIKVNRIPMTLSLEILKKKKGNQGASKTESGHLNPSQTEKIHAFKPMEIWCPNGEKASRIIHLSASKDKGEYFMVAVIKYKQFIQESTFCFSIH